jgi:hypothetical protein
MLKNLKIMTLPLIVLALVHTTFAAGKIVPSYTALEGVLQAGDTVRTIITLTECTTTSTLKPKATDPIFAGLNFEIFNKYTTQVGGQNKDVIATSVAPLVLNNTLGPVYSYARVRVFDDNTVEVFTEQFDPKTYTSLATATFNCAISNGKDSNGVLLLDIS